MITPTTISTASGRLTRRAALRQLAAVAGLTPALLIGGGLLAPFVPSAAAVESDIDGDGLFDDDETMIYGTSPFLADTDGDATLDGVEVALGTDPRTSHGANSLIDTDGDTATDYGEVNIFFTDPLDYDTDNDGKSDGAEVLAGTNPRVAEVHDTDADGLSDADEAYVWKTYSTIFDTDGDGIGDGDEVARNLNPLVSDVVVVGPSPVEAPLDSDNDGLSDFDEQNIWMTDPFNSDSDRDGYNDGFEASQVNLNPLNPDIDGDGMPDGCDSDPNVPDPTRGCVSQS